MDSLARQDGVSGLAEYIFETSAPNELVSNEPSGNESHVGEEPLATDTVELDLRTHTAPSTTGWKFAPRFRHLTS
jgi:hypothetical protein